VTPLVSVVLPAHDAAATLAEAVASVRAQEVASVEILVVDDGSSDDTPAIARALGARALHTPHLGPAGARNAALAEARGGLVAFLDADDLWPPGSLRRLIDALAAAPDAAAAGGLVQLLVLGASGYRSRGAPWRAASLGRTLWRRGAVERVGRFDETLRRAEDLEWLVRARDVGLATVEVDEVTYLYRLHGENLSADVAARNRAILDVLRRRRRRIAP
jgi:glycosyltransferase involved in cell wall biosynthesis